jgi:hypothetical protein
LTTESGAAGESPGSDALRALARKYQVMAQLRATLPPSSHALGEPEPPVCSAGRAEERQALRHLASEFPGALRELDTLPTDEITRRAEALLAAADGRSPVERWMAWMQAYHGLMRAALAVKGKLATGPFSEPDRQALAHRTGVAIDDAFVQAVATPPAGRLMVAVFDRMAIDFGVSAKTLWDTLFPARKGERGYRQR